MDPGKDKAKRKERKDMSLFNVCSNTSSHFFPSSFPSASGCEGGGGGKVERNTGPAPFENLGSNKPWLFATFRLDGMRPAPFRE